MIGDTFAMFVRQQHTGIMIHVPSNEKIDDINNVIVSTIPAIRPSVVYNHNSDYEVIFDILIRRNDNDWFFLLFTNEFSSPSSLF